MCHLKAAGELKHRSNLLFVLASGDIMWYDVHYSETSDDVYELKGEKRHIQVHLLYH